jgi:pSer/pThr/pTyr-binding forkhead associated (FHA) protein
VQSALTLEIVEGPGAGTTVPLQGPLEIGRDPAAGFRLEDDNVDPFHVRVTPADGGALVEDLGELGGTFVNDSEVGAPTRIRPGDELQIGVTVLKLRTAAEAAAGTAARPKPPTLAVAATPSRPAEEDEDVRRVRSLVDVRVKAKAHNAPLALLVLAVYAVLVYLLFNRF